MSYSITPPIIPSLRDTCPVVLVDQAHGCVIRHTSNRYRTVHTCIFLGNQHALDEHIAARQGHAAVAQLPLAARCNIDLQTMDGLTTLQAAKGEGLAAIDTLIRNKKEKGAKDVLLQVRPEKIKKQQEHADRVMKELLEEDEKEKAVATTR